MPRVRWAAAALVAAVLAGCATSPIRLDGREMSVAAAPRRSRTPALPLVIVGPVEDRRSGGESAGSIAGRAVTVKDAGSWLGRTLSALSSPAWDIRRDGDAGAEPPALVLRPRVLKAYVGGLGISKTAVVVLEIEYLGPDGVSDAKTYRGQYVDVNWASTEGEVRRALQAAAASCVEQVRADVEARVKKA